MPIGAVHREKEGRGKVPQGPRWRRAASQKKSSSQTMCYRCGHTPAHDRQQCPAKDAVCNKRGHFKRVCKSAKVGVVQREESEPELSSEDDAFLGAIGQSSTDLWVTKARVNGIFTEFQIDTGAEVTVISERDYKRLGEVTLTPSLRGPNQTLLAAKGQFNGKI